MIGYIEGKSKSAENGQKNRLSSFKHMRIPTGVYSHDLITSNPSIQDQEPKVTVKL
jgi:hypothetical protein